MKKPDKIYRKKLEEILLFDVKPFNDSEKNLITKAFNRAWESYRLFQPKEDFSHYMEVAGISINEIGLGAISVVCSLLHGVSAVHYPFEKIEKEFGKEVREILEGFNRISAFQTERISYNSETFRDLFLSIVGDIRILLIKLAHRIYDLRHLSESSSERQKKIINEVKHVYIPVSHRLGLYNVKTEMEERVMLFEMPDVYHEIEKKIKETKAKREVYIQDFLKPIERELIKNGFEYSLKYRTKSIPSIWAKMNRQNVDFEQVFDLFAIRFILDAKPKKEKEVCWRAYSIITDFYPPNPKRLRDWITTPKASGYESLHTTVKGQGGRWVEVQIRTRRMDEEAEKGQAAHWLYKGIGKSNEGDNWLEQVRDALENSNKSGKSVYKVNTAKATKVFVFTPKGDLKQLPNGATVLDFAYDIHTDVGARCNGARVNNRVVPIRYVLQNGDRVDIMTSKKQKPKIDWLAYVVTERARSRIKRQLKEEKYKEAESGKSLLLRKLKNWKIKSTDDIINFLVKHYKLDTAVDLYYLIATGKLDIAIIKKTITEKIEDDNTPQQVKDENETGQLNLDVTKQPDREEDKEVLWVNDNLKNVNYYFSKCCNPILGDDVFGFVTTQGKISIHRKDCPNAKRLLEKYPYRVLPIKWLETNKETYKNAVIRIQGKDELGLLSEITTLIANDLNINMRSVNFNTKGKTFDGKIVVMIKSVDHLKSLIYRMSKINGVQKVSRIK
jgi:GTP pyrophosphokinase